MTIPGSDRRAAAVLFAIFLPIYGYFFQGGGWNQNARFDTVRALVERGTFEITAYGANTGDLAEAGGRLYSNKPPGLALAGAPVYFGLFHAENLLGADPRDPRLVSLNAHAVTVASSALPAALLLVLVFLHFRREGASLRGSLVLAGGFGLGTLVLPYAGVLMDHNGLALMLFGAWMLLRAEAPAGGRIATCGALLGAALLTDYLAAPAIVLAAAYAAVRFRSARSVMLLLCGPAVAGLLLASHGYLTGSGPALTGYGAQSHQFVDERLFLGVFDWPDWRRLWWLTLHPFRGLLYCCPVLLIGILGWLRGLVERRSIPEMTGTQREIPAASTATAGEGSVASSAWADTAFPLMVVSYFLMFNLCFNGWTGGWGVGPRYLVPALPFIYCRAHRGLSWFPWISAALITLSCAVMLAVTAVAVMLPANSFGPPAEIRPVRIAFTELAAGRVSISTQGMLDRSPRAGAPEPDRPSGSGPPAGIADDGHPRFFPPVDDAWDSYNLGELAGLRGLRSLLPVLLLIAGFWLLPLRVREPR